MRSEAEAAQEGADGTELKGAEEAEDDGMIEDVVDLDFFTLHFSIQDPDVTGLIDTEDAVTGMGDVITETHIPGTIRVTPK